ncbi:MAG: PDZ domain-containing protein [Campylobacterales bacterium]
MKLLFSFVFLALSLFAYDFSKCAKKLSQSIIEVGGIKGVVVAPKRVLLYSPRTPKIDASAIKKRDPFMGLYLVESEKAKRALFFKDGKVDELAVVYKDSFEKIELISPQRIFDFGKANKPLKQGGVISDVCYRVYAFTTPRGYISPFYIYRFLDATRVTYSDIYIDFKQTSRGVEVASSNPFAKNNPFLEGDLVRFIDGKKISTIKDYEDSIYLLPVGTKVDIEIKRDGKTIKIPYTTKMMKYGGLIKGSYFGSLGFSVDKNLVFTDINLKSGGFENLKVGDKLISIDGQKTASKSSLKSLLSKITKKEVKFLVERNGFMFFVTIKTKRS